LEFRVGVGEWWRVFSHKEQEKQEESGVGVQSWSWRGDLGVRGQESGVRSWSSELELEKGEGNFIWSQELG